MDSGSDLSLLEIAREDDSLLLHSQNQNEQQECDNNLFLCSPLVVISRSKPKLHGHSTQPSHLPEAGGNVGTEDTGKSTRSSPNGYVNKEQVLNDNKMEAQKLSVEPQKMKRKKRGGGFNLRKSLAWDRAFFTEGGVLNSSELSMISGNQSMLGEEGMSVIHEEEEQSSLLQSIEENLFKQLSAGTSSELGNESVCRLPKREISARDGVAPGSAVKRKVLAVRDINKSGSKRSGDPRPAVSSSLKRPAIMKVAGKETKVTKAPVSKPNCTSTSAYTTRKATPNSGVSKRNQNVHPIVDLQRNSVPKAPLNNPRSVATNTKNVPAKMSSGARTSTVKIRKPMNYLQTESESQKQSLVSIAKSGVDVIHEKQVSPGPMLSYPGCVPDTVSGSGNIPGYNSQNASCSLDNLQNMQLKTLKTSGLRMPSPSLGFFEQGKPFHSPSLIQKSTLPCNLVESKIPIMRKVGASLKPPLPPQRKPEVFKTIPLRSKLSEGKLNSSVKTNSQKSELKLKKVSTDVGKISRQGQLHTILDCADTDAQDHADENTTPIEDSESQMDEGRILLESEASENLVDVDANGGNSNDYLKSIDLRSVELEGSKVTRTHSPATQLNGGFKICYLKTGLPLEGKVDYLSEISPLIHNLKSVDAHHGKQGASQMNDETSNYAHDDSRQQPREQTQLVKPFVREIDQTSRGSMIPSINNVILEESEIISQASEVDSRDRLHKGSGGNGDASADAHEDKTRPWEQVEKKEPFTCQVVETFNESQGQQSCDSNLSSEGGSSGVFHDIVCTGEVTGGCENGFQGSCMESRSKITEEAKDESNGMDDDVAIVGADAKLCSFERSFGDSKSVLNESAEVNKMAMVFDEMKYEHVDEIETSNAHFQRDTSRRDDCKSDLNVCLPEESTHPNQSVKLCVLHTDGSCGTERESLGSSSPIISQFRDSSLQMAAMVPSQHLTEGQVNSVNIIEVAEYNQSLPKYYQLQPQVTSLQSIETGEDCEVKNTDMEYCMSQPHPIVQATRLTKRNYMNDSEEQADQEKLLSCQTDKITGEKDKDTAASSLVSKLGSNYETEIGHHPIASYNGTSINSDLSTVINEVTEAVTDNLEEHCAVQNDQISCQRIRRSEASAEKAQIILEETKTDINRTAKDCDSDILHAEDVDKCKFEKSGNKSKPEPLLIKPPKNAIPFSDEWLSAFEAAGEEVLTLKSGAVQNSPPDKPQHEPGPWSPVKRKNQVIGPYDCTKCTNITPSTSQ